MNKVLTWLACGATAAAAITMAAPAGAGAGAATPPPPGTSTTAQTLAAAQPSPADAQPGHMQPMWRIAPHPAKTVTPNSIGEPGGYDPEELRSYLKLNGTGEGQTVAIVEPFDVSDSVNRGLAGYDDWYGLKPPCSATVTTGCFKLTFTAPDGLSDPDPTTYLAWGTEAQLDVEIVHAIAPDAAITIVEAYDDTETALFAAVDHAASLHPAAISNSYGEAERAGEPDLDGHCQAGAAPCVFSSGDTGNPGSYPAASPNVVAVGGTTLDMSPTGQVRSEIAWTGSGGGISPYEPQPVYQKTADSYHIGRGIPDVSFDADPLSGFAVYIALVYHGQFLHAGWAETGGTSVGAPAWSAILAVADQQRAARGNPPVTTSDVQTAVYAKKVMGLADITTGSNGVCGAICTANPGYDLVTGQGSPRPGIDTNLARH